MKIRWMQNSLRLRITPSELATLQRGDIIQEELCLPLSSVPVWAVNVSPCTTETEILAFGSSIQIHLCPQDLTKLSHPANEGVYFSCQTKGASFSYYIEKDFPCIHPRPQEVDEPETETFALPLGLAHQK